MNRPPKYWGTNKPPVGFKPDWEIASRLGLTHAWLCNECGGSLLFDVFDPFAFAPFGVGDPGTTGNYWDFSETNVCLMISDSGTGTVNSPAMTIGTRGGIIGATAPTELTIVCKAMVNGTPGGSVCDFGFSGGVRLDVTSGNTLQLVFPNVAALTASTGTFTSNAWNVFIVTFSAAAGQVNYYINGVNAGTVATGSTPLAPDNGFLCRSTSNAASGPPNGTKFEYFLTASQAWTHDTVLRFQDDPYFWMQRPIKRDVAAAAAAGSTRGMPFGTRSTAFNGGRTFAGIIR